jgi:hypothetical protein
MDTISKMILQRMARFPQKQLNFDVLRRPEWAEAADYFHGRCMKY